MRARVEKWTSWAGTSHHIHLSKQATTTMAPFLMSNNIASKLPDWIKIESSHVVTIQLPGISKQDSQIHIFPKMRIAPLMSLGVLCDYVCTIRQDKQEISVQNNRQIIIKVTRNKQTGMWGVPLKTQQSEILTNNIMVQTNKPELAQYLHAALFSPTTSILLKAIKQFFLKTWPGLVEALIKKHL